MTIKYRVKTVKSSKAKTEGTNTRGKNDNVTHRVTMDYTQMLCHLQMLETPNYKRVADKAKIDGYCTTYFEPEGLNKGMSIQISVRRIKV